MKNTLSLVLIAIALALTLTLNLNAQSVYYVAPYPAGNDANSGGINAPWATAAHAESINRCGDTIYFRQGVWYASSPITLTVNGCLGSPISWQSYPGEQATLSGGLRITNWTNVSGNLWQAALPASAVNFESLYYNGVRRFRPRLGAASAASVLGAQYRGTPVSGYYDRFSYNPGDPISTALSWSNYSPSAGNPCGQLAGATGTQGDITIIDFELWDVSRQRVSCVDTVNRVVYLTGSTSTGYSHGYIANHRYIVDNVSAELTQPGQWFLDRSRSPWILNYLANAGLGENPNADTVVVPQSAQVMTGKSIQYRTFVGMVFAHDNYTVPKTGYRGAQSETMIPAMVSCTDCSYLIFDSDTFTETTGQALALATDNKITSTSTGNVIQNSLLYDLGAGGMVLGNLVTVSNTDANTFQSGVIQNNLIQGYGRLYAGAGAINLLSGHDTLIAQNDINDGYSQGIMVCIPSTVRQCAGSNPASSQGTFNISVASNHVWNLGQGIMNDFGCVYLATYAATGNSIIGNKCHDISDASTQDADGYGANGIYIDRGGPITVQNNLVYRTGNALSLTIPMPTIMASNNIFAYSRTKIVGTFACATGMQFNFANNIVLMDRTSRSLPAFYVQSGMTYTGAGVWQNYSGNDYWNTTETFTADAKAFTSENSTCKGPAHYTLAGWQALGEDAGSVSVNPGFSGAAYPVDDYSFAGGTPPMAGFVSFCVAGTGMGCPGRTSGMTVPAIAPGFQTMAFDPAKDY